MNWKTIEILSSVDRPAGKTVQLQKFDLEGGVFFGVVFSECPRPHTARDTESEAQADFDAVLEVYRLAARTPEQRCTDIEARNK